MAMMTNPDISRDLRRVQVRPFEIMSYIKTVIPSGVEESISNCHCESDIGGRGNLKIINNQLERQA